MLLQSKLANVSMTFKDVLELRTQVGFGTPVCHIAPISSFCQNMKESKDRTEQFMSSASSAASQAPSSESRYMLKQIATNCHVGSLLLGGGRQRQQAEPNGEALGAPRFPDAKGKGRAAQNGDILAMDLVTAEEGTATEGNGGAFMQMQLVEQQVGALVDLAC
jgi:syntaxin 5